MEDFKWLFYFLGLVVILVLRMWRKAFQTPAPSNRKQPVGSQTYPVPAPPATSYQDILKEMQASESRAKKAASSVPNLPQRQTLERTNIPAKSLERTETRANSLEAILRQPKEVIRKPNAIELARQEKPKIITSAPSPDYAKLLHNTQNVRTAFILSEVFTRKLEF